MAASFLLPAGSAALWNESQEVNTSNMRSWMATGLDSFSDDSSEL